jgi:inorganic pyrophosphatase
LSELSIWESADVLVARSAITIDRPEGRPHPRFPQFVYPLPYGYLEGTMGGDGDGIDVWVGPSGRSVTAMAVCIDPIKRNAEVKLILGCGDDEIERIEVFYATQPQAASIVRRPERRETR